MPTWPSFKAPTTIDLPVLSSLQLQRVRQDLTLDAGTVRDYPGGYASYDAHRGRGKELTLRSPVPPTKGTPTKARR